MRTPVRKSTCPTGHEHFVYPAAFSPDCRTLDSGSMDNTVPLSDAVTCKLRGTLEVHKYGVGSAAPRSEGVGSLKWNGDSNCPPPFFGPVVHNGHPLSPWSPSLSGGRRNHFLKEGCHEENTDGPAGRRGYHHMRRL